MVITIVLLSLDYQGATLSPILYCRLPLRDDVIQRVKQIGQTDGNKRHYVTMSRDNRRDVMMPAVMTVVD